MSDSAEASEQVQAAAEEVRAHLVALRGGAPFLSPADSRALLAWLDAGRGVPELCLALERAAEARRKKRGRVPLGLRHARPYLDKPRPVGRQADRLPARAVHPLAALGAGLSAAPGPEPRALAAALLALPSGDPEALLRDALAHTRAFLRALWDRMSQAEREARLAEARAELASIGISADSAEAQPLAEELVREGLRAAWPGLSAEALWEAACQ